MSSTSTSSNSLGDSPDRSPTNDLHCKAPVGKTVQSSGKRKNQSTSQKRVCLDWSSLSGHALGGSFQRRTRSCVTASGSGNKKFDMLSFLLSDESLAPDHLTKRPPKNYSYLDSQGNLRDPKKYSKMGPLLNVAKPKPLHPRLARHIREGTDTRMNRLYYKDMPPNFCLPIAGKIRESPVAADLAVETEEASGAFSREDPFQWASPMSTKANTPSSAERSTPSSLQSIPPLEPSPYLKHMHAMVFEDRTNFQYRSPYPILSSACSSMQPQPPPLSNSAPVFEKLLQPESRYRTKKVVRSHTSAWSSTPSPELLGPICSLGFETPPRSVTSTHAMPSTSLDTDIFARNNTNQLFPEIPDKRLRERDFRLTSLNTKIQVRNKLTSLQEENFHARPSIRLVVPDHIKAILVDDWENVTKSQQLIPLPAAHTVSAIVDDYMAFEAPKRQVGSAQEHILEEVVAGLKDYFEKCLGRILLYRFERHQYTEVREAWASSNGDLAGKTACDTYGAEHLCRLLVTLPELIAQTNMDAQSVNRLREELSKMTNWLGRNAEKYFVKEYETPSQEYVDKARSV